MKSFVAVFLFVIMGLMHIASAQAVEPKKEPTTTPPTNSLLTKDNIGLVPGLITAFLLVLNWKAMRFRNKLKEDLEIQKRYREELLALGMGQDAIAKDAYYEILRAKIHRKINKAYNTKGTDWSDAAFAAFFFSSAIYFYFMDEALIGNFQIPFFALLSVVALIYAWAAIRDRHEVLTVSETSEQGKETVNIS